MVSSQLSFRQYIVILPVVYLQDQRHLFGFDQSRSGEAHASFIQYGWNILYTKVSSATVPSHIWFSNGLLRLNISIGGVVRLVQTSR